MRHRLAFTLMEMLVVITIIALLMALVTPAFFLIRDTAHTTACLSNLRQMTCASNNFTADHQGFLCPVNGWHYSDSSRYWNRILAPYCEDSSSQQSRGNFNRRSIQWGCPAWTKTQDALRKAQIADYWYYLTRDNQCGYGMNDAFTRAGSDALENGWWYIDNNHYYPSDASADLRWANRATDTYPLLVRAAVVPTASGQPFIVDGYLEWSHPWYQAYGSDTGRQAVIERHRGKGNCLYLDGHATHISGAQWAANFWNPTGN